MKPILRRQKNEIVMINGSAFIGLADLTARDFKTRRQPHGLPIKTNIFEKIFVFSK